MWLIAQYKYVSRYLMFEKSKIFEVSSVYFSKIYVNCLIVMYEYWSTNLIINLIIFN